ncbi:cullin-1-like isoform X2 [Rhododendron vialii]|uniref:cullin-1-like isoform X2 n=1 Tax=Rhododendron vialii TaxID=182163 RepID=UPI00265E5565|nr:cullin-1-like isoform X2 [Rhododendron vialii]
MAISETTHKFLKFEEGWPLVQEGIKKAVEIAEGVRSDRFTAEESMRLYTVVYEICQPHPAGPECEKLYQGYKKTFEDYITAKVLPFLREKKDENLLQELVTKWNMHKVLTRWLVRFFHYLDRYFISIRKLPTLNATSLLTFYKLVYIEMNDQVREVVLSMIEREREGVQIDQALVKNVLDIYVEIGEGSMTYYAKDFEEAMLKDTASFYSKKATIWNASLSYKDYVLKVEECIMKEEDRVSCYLQSRSRQKLLEVVEHELRSVHATKLVEKKQLESEAASTNE